MNNPYSSTSTLVATSNTTTTDTTTILGASQPALPQPASAPQRSNQSTSSTASSSSSPSSSSKNEREERASPSQFNINQKETGQDISNAVTVSTETNNFSPKSCLAAAFNSSESPVANTNNYHSNANNLPVHSAVRNTKKVLIYILIASVDVSPIYPIKTKLFC